MLQQELPLLDSRPIDGTLRWLTPAIAVAAAITGAGLLWLAGAGTAAILFLAICVIAFPAVALLRREPAIEAPDLERLVVAPDYSLVGSMLGLTSDAAALTDAEGKLLAANSAYRDRFEGRPPDKLAADFGISAVAVDRPRNRLARRGWLCCGNCHRRRHLCS